MKFGDDWREHADRGDYHTAIVEYIRERELVTFREAAACLADYIDVEGGCGLRLPTDSNVIIWDGMSRAVSDLLIALLRDGRLYLQRCDVTPYQLGGWVLKLPVIDAVPSGPLSQPHWLPCLLSTEDDSEGRLLLEFNPAWN